MHADRLRRPPSAALNVADHVAFHARRRPTALALCFGDGRWTYAELHASAARGSNVLGALGVGPGDRVALHLPNSPTFVVAYLAALRLGAIPVALAPSWRSDMVGAAMRDVAPRCLVTTSALHRRLAADPSAPDLPALLVNDDAHDAAASPAGSWWAALSRARDTAPMWRGNSDSPAAILFSSGTTAEPKGVVLSHANIAINARLKAEYCRLRNDDRVALVLPLFHCFGQNAVMNAAFHAGACVMLAERFDAAALVAQIVSGEISVLFGVPQLFSRLMDVGALTARSRGVLRYALSAATTLPASAAERWRNDTGLAMHEAYGLTESSPFAAYNHTDGHRPGTLGSPIAGVQMAVVDSDGDAPCRAGDHGEIVLRGHNVMLGYWNRPDETARAIRGGWLRTGDIGFADDRGSFHLVGRAADVVKVAGFRVLPATVEAALLAHPTVVEAAAFGINDPVHGEILEAAVVLAPARAADADALRRHCAARLAPFEVPSRVHLCRELPRSVTGKISRSALRAASAHSLGLQQALDARLTLST